MIVLWVLYGTGEMAPVVKSILLFLQRIQGWFSALTCCSQMSVTLVPGGLMHSGLFRNLYTHGAHKVPQAHTFK